MEKKTNLISTWFWILFNYAYKKMKDTNTMKCIKNILIVKRHIKRMFNVKRNVYLVLYTSTTFKSEEGDGARYFFFWYCLCWSFKRIWWYYNHIQSSQARKEKLYNHITIFMSRYLHISGRQACISTGVIFENKGKKITILLKKKKKKLCSKTASNGRIKFFQR